MKKMYFAMIPKRSFLESAVITIGVGAGLVYGAKWLVGEEKFNEYTKQLKDIVFNSSAKDFSQTDTGFGLGDEDARAKEEENILDRIRKAASGK